MVKIYPIDAKGERTGKTRPMSDDTWATLKGLNNLRWKEEVKEDELSPKSESKQKKDKK